MSSEFPHTVWALTSKAFKIFKNKLEISQI